MHSAAIVVVSDTRSSGERKDETTELVRAALVDAGHEVVSEHLVPDEREQVAELLRRLADEDGVALVITTGGTGFGPRDITPEATGDVVERIAPGLSEVMRAETAALEYRSWLSRGTAGLRGRTLIVNLPGSTNGVRDCMSVLVPLLGHALDVARRPS